MDVTHDKVNLSAKFGQISDYGNPRIAGGAPDGSLGESGM